jgi:hypothetical protein
MLVSGRVIYNIRLESAISASMRAESLTEAIRTRKSSADFTKNFTLKVIYTVFIYIHYNQPLRIVRGYLTAKLAAYRAAAARYHYYLAVELLRISSVLTLMGFPA